jgi:hypothetical protein
MNLDSCCVLAFLGHYALRAGILNDNYRTVVLTIENDIGNAAVAH